MTDIISRSSVSKTRSPVVDSRFLSSQLSTRYPTDRILILPAFPSLLFLLSLLACVSLSLSSLFVSLCLSRDPTSLFFSLLRSCSLLFSLSLALCVRAWVCHSECLDACLSLLLVSCLESRCCFALRARDHRPTLPVGCLSLPVCVSCSLLSL